MFGFDLLTRPSDVDYQRILSLHEKVVPLVNQIKMDREQPLTKVLLDSCEPVLKKMVQVEPPSEDPGNNLWVSPSDSLLGKVVLKPPLTTKHVQALTHKGILEIGRIIEEQIERKHNLEKEALVEEAERIMAYMAEKQKKEAVQNARKQEQIAYEQIINNLKEQFKKTLARELDALEKKHEKELIVAAELAKEQAKIELDRKLEIVVAELFRRITEEFGRELLKQSLKLHQHFWYHLKEERQKLAEAVETEKKKCTENLAHLRHELHCENIANVMYVLANTRRECECEKEAIEQYYIGELTALEKQLDDRNEIIMRLLQETQISNQKILARESLLFEIVKQFQKFIYFAMKAAPQQAEFLLDVEKLMIFEFTKTCFENSSELAETIENILSQTGSTTTQKSMSSISCLKLNSEADLSKTSKMSLDSDIPAVIFNENMYIREDFRNMLSQGLKISKSNELWNQELEKITNDLIPIRIEEDPRFTTPRNSKSSKHPSKSTSVRFSLIKGSKITGSFDSNEKVLTALDYDKDLSSERIRTERISYDLRGGVPQSLDTFTKLEEPSDSDTACDQCPDCCSMSSLLKKNKNTKVVKGILTEILTPIFEKEKTDKNSVFEKHRDSLTLIRESIKRRSTMPIFPKKISRLIDAADSLILLKSKDSIKSKKSNPSDSCLKTRNVAVQYENLEKNVQYSHIEIIPDDNHKKSVVTFFPKPELITEEVPAPTVNKKEKQRKRAVTRSSVPLSEGVRIVGDPSFREQFKSSEDFTLRRMNSLGKIFRRNPSLCNLFTQVLTN